MHLVFVDESGYTGADLLNEAQRFHTVAAISMSAERAESIIARHFGRVASSELKFANVIRRPNHRAALLGAIPEIAADGGAVGYIFCKRYALWLKLLDDCVEPVCYRNGVPFYDNGGNRSMAGLLHSTSGVFWGTERRDAILSAYQAAVRSRHPDDLTAFLRAVRAIKGCKLSEFFVPTMLEDRDVLESILHPASTLDLSYPLALGLITWLESHVLMPYRVVHDKNKSIDASLGLFAAIASIRIPATFKVSSTTQLQYPLKCDSVTTADSRDDPRLQLADLIAGSVRFAAEVLRGLKSDPGFVEPFLKTIPNDALIFNLPSTDFDDIKTTFHGTDGQMIDFLAQQMHRVARRTS